MSLGERIAEQRKRMGLSQEELAGRLSVSKQTVQRWEAEKATPGLDNLVGLSVLFGTSTEYLLKGTMESIHAEAEPQSFKTPTHNTKTKQNNRVLLTIISLIVCIAVITTCGILLYPRFGKSNTDSEEENANYTENPTSDVNNTDTPIMTSTPSPELKDEKEKTDINLANIAKSVLYLEVYDIDDTLIGTASGFIIDDGTTLVTNYHVIENAFRIVAKTADGKKETSCSKVIASSEETDLAVLRCSKDLKVKPLEIGNSNSVSQGDTVFAIGYPLGIANTLSDGIVSSVYLDENGVEIIQITAPISSGSSGGAVLDENGQVVGIICAYYEHGQNLNVSISSNELTKLLNNKSSSKEIDLFSREDIEFHSVTVEDLYNHPQEYDGCFVTLTDWVGFSAYVEKEGVDHYEEAIVLGDDYFVVGKQGPVFSSDWTDFPYLFLASYYYEYISSNNVEHICAIIWDSDVKTHNPKYNVKLTVYGRFSYNPTSDGIASMTYPATYQVEVFDYSYSAVKKGS